MFYRNRLADNRSCSFRYTGGLWLPARKTTALAFMRMPCYAQLDRHSCGYVAAVTVLESLGKQFGAMELAEDFRFAETGGVTDADLVDALIRRGVQARCKRLDYRELRAPIQADIPVIIAVHKEHALASHYVTVYGVDSARRRIHTCNDNVPSLLFGRTFEGLRAIWPE